MSKLSKIIAKNDFVREGLCSNYWLWAHIAIACSIARVFKVFISPLPNLVITFLIMVIWELYEYFAMYKSDSEIIIDEYGSYEKYVYDSIGDVITPLFVIILILY